MSTSFAADRDLFTGARETAPVTAYRDPLERARANFVELAAALDESLEAAEARAYVRIRRVARSTFGAIGIGGAIVMSSLAGYDALQGYGHGAGVSLKWVLLGSWIVASIGWAIVRLFGAALPRVRNPAPTGVLSIDIQRYEAEEVVRRDGRFLARRSLALPAIAVSLLAPLTLHWIFTSVVWNETRAFDEWIMVSLAIVGHAHIALAIFAARFMSKFAGKSTFDMGLDKSYGFTALFLAVAVSAVPGILFFAIPPALVFVTGLAFVPFLWLVLKRIAIHERSMLELAGIEIF
jgi:hypothetical protein